MIKCEKKGNGVRTQLSGDVIDIIEEISAGIISVVENVNSDFDEECAAEAYWDIITQAAVNLLVRGHDVIENKPADYSAKFSRDDDDSVVDGDHIAQAILDGLKDIELDDDDSTEDDLPLF